MHRRIVFFKVKKSWSFGQRTENPVSDRILDGVTDRPGAKNLSQHSQYLCNFATLSPQHGFSLADSQHVIRLAILQKTMVGHWLFQKLHL
jgi:hypothetical protein